MLVSRQLREPLSLEACRKLESLGEVTQMVARSCRGARRGLLDHFGGPQAEHPGPSWAQQAPNDPAVGAQWHRYPG